MKKQQRKDRLTRKPVCEALEPRLTMSGSPSALSHAEGLTLSFVPDGTKVQGLPSSLNQTLGVTAGIAQWQQTIARAFQTWAQYADVNVGIVADGGQPLGIQGPAHGDTRFGDIRVTGVSLSPDTMGEAIGERRTIAGSWAGDVVLNMDATWANADKLFQVALHEAGHSLGLEHSADPNSPMFAHAGALTNGPTAADIAHLQTLYGTRRSDVFEGSNGNETISRAARIPHAEVTDGFNGTTPLVVYGNIRDTADKDVFLLPVLTGYQGPLTFQLWTSGISLLQGRISVLDQDGNVLATAQSGSQLGDVLTVQMPAATATKYYIQVEPATNDVFAAGAYGLVVKYDQLITSTAADIQKAVLQGHQWEVSTDDSAAEVDVRKLLVAGSTAELADDGHADDTTDGAKALTPVFDTAAVRRFQFVGTVSDTSDSDTYRLRSQSASSATRGLTISVENLEDGGLVPQVTILDKTGALVPTSFVANGLGLVMLRAANIQANQDYFVSIAGAHGTGNYAVTALFDETPVVRTLLTAGQVTASQPVHLENLYVARPQLFSFALSSLAAAGSPAGQSLWATIYDDRHRTVAFIGQAAGEFRSTDSVLLSPGTYHIRVEGRDSTGTVAASASYQLFADVISDPLGPPLVDTTTAGLGDFVCAADGSNSAYCYPGDIHSDSPFVTGVTDQPPVDEPLADINPPPDNWFSPPDYVPSNPSEPLDVNGDTVVAPDDALDVINYINSNGAGPDALAPDFSGYLDTDNDGYVVAQDVLEIINELNSDVPVLSALAEGPFEGEAGPALATVGQVADLAAATPITTYLGATRLDAAWLDLLTFDLAQQTSRARRPL